MSKDYDRYCEEKERQEAADSQYRTIAHICRSELPENCQTCQFKDGCKVESSDAAPCILQQLYDMAHFAHEIETGEYWDDANTGLCGPAPAGSAAGRGSDGGDGNVAV